MSDRTLNFTMVFKAAHAAAKAAVAEVKAGVTDLNAETAKST